MENPEADHASRQRPSAGRGGKAAERLRMFHQARGLALEPVDRYASDYSAAVLAAISAAEGAGAGGANLPQWRFLGPELIPNGQTSRPGTRMAVSGRISGVAIDPVNRNHLLCGSALGGIWESFTRGADWAPRTDFLRTLTTGALAFDPNNARNNTNIAYAGTGEGNSYWYFGQGVLRSTDGGTTWAVLAAGPFVGVGFFAIIVDRANSQHILAATRGQAASGAIPATGGIYESADGGSTWNQVYAASACWDISMQPGGGTSAEVLAATSDGLLRSIDGGHTWSAQAPVQLPGAPASWTRLAVSISPGDATVAYAFGASGATPYLWRRAQGTWSAIATPKKSDGTEEISTAQAAYDWCAAISPDNPGQVYLGGIDMYRGDVAADGTCAWTYLTGRTAANSLHSDHHAIAFDPADPAAVYCGCDGGVFRSADRGISWVSLNAGLAITEVIYMVHDNATTRWLLAGTQDNGTLRYLGTSTFESVDDGDGGDCGIDQTPRAGAVLSTSYDSYINMWIERSTQGGARGTFQVITPNLPPGYDSLFYPPVSVFGSTVAIAGQTVWLSRDTGTTWAQVTLPGSTQLVTALYLAGTGLIYAATFAGLVYRIDFANGAWTPPR